MCYLNRSTFHLVLIFLLNLCHSEDKFHIEKNYVVIQDDSSPFEQRVKITDRTNFSICADSHTIYCLQWQDHTLFNVTEKNECKFFKYTSTTEDQLRVSFNTSLIHIYGGAETDYQKWPAENIEYENFPFVSSSTRSQAVLEPFWIFSTGHYLYVEKRVPLFISMSKTENKFEIFAQNQIPYMAANETILKYRICTLGDMKKAYLHAVENVLGKPKKIMDAIMVQKPIWSTWVKFKENISVKILGDYIDEILLHDFPISHLEIDDKWEDCYGSLTLDTSRFPDFKKFVTKLKSKGIRTTIWVHPFINLDCHPFYEQAETNGYFVRNATGIRTTWWNGDAGYLDFTNNETSLWFQKRLEKLKNDTGVDSFKFDAGESSWSPERATFKTMDSSYPETILKSYVKMASNFGNMVEVRVGRGTQQYGIFVRMLDTDSLWNGPKTLETFIPTLLQMNMLGYPFVLPDMIGGNEYNGNKITDELLIRWLQANVFMPTLQFSVPPWDFGKEITKIALKMVKLHKTYSNEILYLMKKSTKTGIPVNLPLWWISPNDTITYNISDEFLLGENILVAPVLIKGAQSRDIYLPKGAWRAENKKKSKLIVGPKWLRNYKAEIDTLPYFIKEYNNGQAPQKFAFNKVIISLITVIILSLV